MASISHDEKTGRRRIQFTGPDGTRKTVRLGRVSGKQAESVQRFIEDLLASIGTGSPIQPATADWVAGLPSILRKRLERAGVIAPQQRRERLTFDQWVRRYIEGRTDAKPNTVRNYWQAHGLAAKAFGGEYLGEITLADADGLRVSMKSQGYSEGYTRRRCGIIRQFFAAAMRAKLITENPFAGVKCGNYADGSRFYFLSRHDAEAVLAACPDAEWKLIFALCRYGGLRCPTEVLRLTWGDVDWERERFTVHASKTEHNDGGGVRVVPIFPELRPHLQEAFDLAEAGALHVITRYRETNQNLRTQLRRIIGRAGLAPWPKLFQNLRSTRETELCEIFPDHVVTKWLGNSPAVARKHYLQVTEDHFERAAKGSENTGATRNPTQQHADDSRDEPQGEHTDSQNPVFAGSCKPLRDNALDQYARQDSNL